MALRRIAEFTESKGTGSHGRAAVVYRDAEWNEYRIRFHEWWEYLPQADYHTDDRQDALGTAANWCHLPT